MKNFLMKKKSWVLGTFLLVATLGVLQSCGKDNGTGVGGVTFYGAGS